LIVFAFIVSYATNALAIEFDSPRSTTGQCIVAEGKSHEQTTQPGVYEHYVKARNQCAAKMEVRACYEGTNSCIQFSVRGGSESTGTLGLRIA
jgi:hypothetical protein